MTTPKVTLLQNHPGTRFMIEKINPTRRFFHLVGFSTISE
jgi:hypothetical protein